MMKKFPLIAALAVLSPVSLTMPLVAQETPPAAVIQVETVVAFNQDLDGYEYPFPVAYYRFESQGKELKMAYMYLPPKDDKPVIVLLHGKNFNGAYWQQTAEHLHNLGYGVLMPDQIGFGKSSKEDEYQYSFAALAANTKGLIDMLDIEKPVIVGHSMGGMLASRFALMYPEHTSRLILVNPIGLENYLQYVQYKDVNFFYQSELQQTPEMVVAYQQKHYYDGAWNDTYAALTEPLIGWMNGDDWDDVAKVNALTYDMIFTQPVIEEFKDFTMPVSLIIGTRDRTAPGNGWKKDGGDYELGRYDRLGEAVKKRNPAITVTELDDLGHMPHIEDFDRFKTAFDKAVGF